MKKILPVMVMVAFLVVSAPLAEAWEVIVKNSCNKEAIIVVEGHHLLFAQNDCQMTVRPNETGVCPMPGGICPMALEGSFFSGDSHYHLNHVDCAGFALVPACWNVNAEIVQDNPNSCSLKLR